MKTKNIARLAASFIIALFVCMASSCSSLKGSAKKSNRQMQEVRKATLATSYNESRDLDEFVSYMKKEGLGILLSEAKAKAEAVMPTSPTGYAGRYKIYPLGVGKTEVGREFAIPEDVYLDKPIGKMGVLAPESEYEMRARFVNTIGVITLLRIGGGEGNKVFCFSENVNELEKAEISENSIFFIEDTKELTSGGERVVRVRAVGLEGRVYEGKHRAPPLERVKRKKSTEPKEAEPSGPEAELKRLMRRPAATRAA